MSAAAWRWPSWPWAAPTCSCSTSRPIAFDIPSQEILQQVLADYEGTILLVSHDRYLIDALATQIWEIDERQEQLRVFKGSYSLYRAEQEQQREAARAALEAERTKARPARGRPLAPSGEQRRRLKRLQETETLIEKLESELSLLGARLENPPQTRRSCTSWAGLCSHPERPRRPAARMGAGQ